MASSVIFILLKIEILVKDSLMSDSQKYLLDPCVLNFTRIFST